MFSFGGLTARKHSTAGISPEKGDKADNESREKNLWGAGQEAGVIYPEEKMLERREDLITLYE